MRRTPEQRRADRAAGVDRFGRPLPRALGTNPRAQRSAQTDAGAPGPREGQSSPGRRAVRVTRDQARRVPCPVCGALAGEPCLSRRGDHRASAHAQRHERAVAVLAGPSRDAARPSPAGRTDASRSAQRADAPARRLPTPDAATPAPAAGRAAGTPELRDGEQGREPLSSPRCPADQPGGAGA
jgi:hypothetical protein